MKMLSMMSGISNDVKGLKSSVGKVEEKADKALNMATKGQCRVLLVYPSSTARRAPRYDLLPNGHRLAKLTFRGPDPSAPPFAASDCSPSWGPTGPPLSTVAVVGGAGAGVISPLARVRGDGTGAKLNRSASRSGAGGADSAAGWAPAGTLR